MAVSDAALVAAVRAASGRPWFKLGKAGVAEGQGGGATLTATTFAQRVNTAGGLAPSTGCASPADVFWTNSREMAW